MDKKTVFFLGLSIAILLIMLYFVGIDKVIAALKIAKLEFIALQSTTSHLQDVEGESR